MVSFSFPIRFLAATRLDVGNRRVFLHLRGQRSPEVERPGPQRPFHRGGILFLEGGGIARHSLGAAARERGSEQKTGVNPSTASRTAAGAADQAHGHFPPSGPAAPIRRFVVAQPRRSAGSPRAATARRRRQNLARRARGVSSRARGSGGVSRGGGKRDGGKGVE